jgi:Domain of unknown function (DUF4133)
MQNEQKFTIHKGVDRPLEFKGLQGRYLIGLAAVAIATLIAFGVLHAVGINSWLGVCLALSSGASAIQYLYRLNKKYGQYGRMKQSAQRALPKSLANYSRKQFIKLYSDGTSNIR